MALGPVAIHFPAAVPDAALCAGTAFSFLYAPGRYERRYPLKPGAAPAGETGNVTGREAVALTAVASGDGGGGGGGGDGGARGDGGSGGSSGDGGDGGDGGDARPPEWLARVMSIVYPGSLGVDEGIAHLAMKASVSVAR